MRFFILPFFDIYLSACVLAIDPLAYLTAKTNGLTDLAQEILDGAGLTELDMEDVPTFGLSTLKAPPIITATPQLIWPSISTGENVFEKALVNGHIEGAGDVPYVNGIEGAAGTSAVDDWTGDDHAAEDDDVEDAAGWDLDTEEIEAQAEIGEEAVDGIDDEAGAGATPGVSETELWVRNSPFAADHVAAGSFETAMQVRYFVLPEVSTSRAITAATQPSTRRCCLRASEITIHCYLPRFAHIPVTQRFASTVAPSHPAERRGCCSQPRRACGSTHNFLRQNRVT